MYMCGHSQTDDISWRVNGKVFGVEIRPPNITSGTVPGDGGTVLTLAVGGTSENNGSSVQCLALLGDGRLETTLPVEFLVQGQTKKMDMIRFFNNHRTTG